MGNQLLIVEDSQLVSFHLQKVLEKAGYHILAALTSGEEAIEFVKDQKPDLILMDIMLDGELDGIEASIMINELVDVPIIYLTALNDESTLERVKGTFPYSFLNKPFSESELLSNVELSLFKHESDLHVKESEELFSTLFNIMDNGAILANEKCEILHVNQSAEKALKKSEGELTGRILMDDLVIEKEDGTSVSIDSCKKEGVLARYISDAIHFVKDSENVVPISNLFIGTAHTGKDKKEQLIFTFRDATEVLAHQENEKEKERIRLSYLIEGTELERARVSRELHDGLGQLLNVIKMSISEKIAETPEKKHILTLMNQAITDTGKISDDLLPSKLRDFDLITCLNDLCDQYKGVGFSIDIVSNLKKLELDSYKINVYRIVQEALTNISKHAEASNVSIQLYKSEGDLISLTIEDDGVGFDTNELKEKRLHGQSHGVMNMIDRARIMNGTFEIESNKDLGTMITVQFEEKIHDKSIISR